MWWLLIVGKHPQVIWFFVFFSVETSLLYNGHTTPAIALAIIYAWCQVVIAWKISPWIAIGVPLVVSVLLNPVNRKLYMGYLRLQSVQPLAAQKLDPRFYNGRTGNAKDAVPVPGRRF